MERHGLSVLNQLREYDSFLDSLRVIADMGCGAGEDITWWATLETRDDPPQPYNYRCYAVDKDPNKLSQLPKLPNLHKLNLDFTVDHLPTSVDLMWAHDSLQYSSNPVGTLAHWNSMLNVNGMLIICVRQQSGVKDNRYYSRTHSGCYHNFTPTSLIYMLAVNGFDCKDAYLLKQFNDEWIHMAVYKSDIPPMEPNATTWYDLIDAGLLHPTVVNSINTYGYLRQEDLLYPWLDKENYFVDYVTQLTEVPKTAIHTDNGVQNTTVEVDNSTVKQNIVKKVEVHIEKPIGILRPPKKKYD